MKQILIIAVLAMAVLPPALGQSDRKKTTQSEPGIHVTLLNQSFGEAQVQRDIGKLDRLLADDFTLINLAGGNEFGGDLVSTSASATPFQEIVG